MKRRLRYETVWRWNTEQASDERRHAKEEEVPVKAWRFAKWVFRALSDERLSCQV